MAELTDLLAKITPLTLDGRQKIPGLPKARADVFPTALQTVITVAQVGDFAKFDLSLYNLRWGLAAEAFEL